MKPPAANGIEVRDFALQVVTSRTLEAKLAAAPRGLTDHCPGPALRIDRPGRPLNLSIVPSSSAKVPPLEGMADPRQRGRILHALANHELQAAELFAWALLAFPSAPREFRDGLLRILSDEQRHCRMYASRLGEWGGALGDYPVSGYFWGKVKRLGTPLEFVCAMGLTFENANLDHTAETARAARSAGDDRTAAILEAVGRDEMDHVGFAWRWLGEWKEEGQEAAEAYLANVTWPLRPALARGAAFHPERRAAAGLDPEFIRLLAEAERGAGARGDRIDGREGR